MSIRTQVNVLFKAGRDNALTNLIANQGFQMMLDTMLHAADSEYTLDPGETNVAIGMGGVADGRLWYILASGELQVTFSGTPGIVASIVSAAGSYNTGFAVDTQFEFIVDGYTVPVTFTSADQTRAQVIQRINSSAMLAGVPFMPATAGPGGTQITLAGQLATDVGEVQVTVALATIGFSTATANGTNPGGGAAPLDLRRPITPDATTAPTLKTFLFGTVRASGMTISNLDADAENVVYVGVVGDLDSSYGSC